MSSLYKSLLLNGLISIAPTLTFTANPNPEPTEPELTEQEAAQATPILTLDLNQAKELAIPYIATLLPLSQDTLTFAHTHADELCNELLFNLEHRHEAVPAQKQAVQKLTAACEILCKHLIMLPAPDLQSALKNPKTKALLQELANRWAEVEKLNLSLYPVATCPIMHEATQKGLTALHALAADLWSVAKTNGASFFTKPIKPLTIKEKAQLVVVVRGLCTALNQLITRSFDATLQCKEQSKNLVEALRMTLKDEVLYKELMAKIGQSQRATAEEKFYDALLALALNAETINSATLDTFRKAYGTQNQAIIDLLQAEQEKLTFSIMKLQQVIFDLFMTKRPVHQA